MKCRDWQNMQPIRPISRCKGGCGISAFAALTGKTYGESLKFFPNAGHDGGASIDDIERALKRCGLKRSLVYHGEDRINLPMRSPLPMLVTTGGEGGHIFIALPNKMIVDPNCPGQTHPKWYRGMYDYVVPVRL